MARARTLALCGLDRGEEAAIREFFDPAVRRCGIPWALASESEADALLIDVDSMYGQMSWLRAQGGPRPIVALTGGTRADADFLLPRPATLESLSGVLSMLTERVTAQNEAAPTAAAKEARATAAPKPAAAAVVGAAPTPVQAKTSAPLPPTIELPRPDEVAVAAAPAAEPEPPRRDLQLVDYLQGRLPGAVRLRGSEPALVVDPIGKTFLGNGSLKPFLAIAVRTGIGSDEWEAVTPHEFDKLAKELGGPHPLPRLQWVAGLGAGSGQLRADLADAQRFKLGKYPTTEREFPKHIRIATAMLKQLSTPDELAATSGMERADVCDFINACHALGLVETDAPAPAAPEPDAAAKGGLLGRLRGKR